jgi:hypothetical protein
MNLLQTILEGALGGLTFGIYHSYVSMREMKKFNEKVEKERQTILFDKYIWKI